MNYRTDLQLDHTKIKEDDRKHLLNRYLTELVTSYQGSMHNSILTISLLAILISIFTLIYQTKILWIIINYSIVALAGLIIFIGGLKLTQKKLSDERKRLIKEYDDLFKYHFNYAIRN